MEFTRLQKINKEGNLSVVLPLKITRHLGLHNKDQVVLIVVAGEVRIRKLTDVIQDKDGDKG